MGVWRRFLKEPRTGVYLLGPMIRFGDSWCLQPPRDGAHPFICGGKTAGLSRYYNTTAADKLWVRASNVRRWLEEPAVCAVLDSPHTLFAFDRVLQIYYQFGSLIYDAFGYHEFWFTVECGFDGDRWVAEPLRLSDKPKTRRMKQ